MPPPKGKMRAGMATAVTSEKEAATNENSIWELCQKTFLIV